MWLGGALYSLPLLPYQAILAYIAYKVRCVSTSSVSVPDTIPNGAHALCIVFPSPRVTGSQPSLCKVHMKKIGKHRSKAMDKEVTYVDCFWF